MVMEAVYIKVSKEDRDAEKEAQRKQWKKQERERLKQITR